MNHRLRRLMRCIVLPFLWSATGWVQAAAGQYFDHAPFDRLLLAHVRDGRVDYEAFRRSASFEGYLEALATFEPRTLGRDDRLAFWLNTYNAYTIALIIRHHETRSIRNINRRFGFLPGGGPWSERLAAVGDSTYTLDEIEHGIIRPEFREPRIHFALVCAARGCPPLRSEAYTGSRLEEQLDDQARQFLLHSPGKNEVDPLRREVRLSALFGFKDYERDFGGDRRQLTRYLARFYPVGPARAMLEDGSWRSFGFTDYDWRLNSLPATDQGTPPGP